MFHKTLLFCVAFAQHRKLENGFSTDRFPQQALKNCFWVLKKNTENTPHGRVFNYGRRLFCGSNELVHRMTFYLCDNWWRLIDRPVVDLTLRSRCTRIPDTACLVNGAVAARLRSRSARSTIPVNGVPGQRLTRRKCLGFNTQSIE